MPGASPSLSAKRAKSRPSTRQGDVNAIVAGILHDLALAQTSKHKAFGYKRAAAAIFELEHQLSELLGANGSLPRISGIGPASERVLREVLETGRSTTVEKTVRESAEREEIERARALRGNYLSRAEVLRVLADPEVSGPSLAAYRGDLQMHSEWSDGTATLDEIAEACMERGYLFAAVTDHSYGLPIAGGMTMAEAAQQRRAIARINARHRGKFALLQGVEANIGAAGELDLSESEAAKFDLVLAAPHSRLRKDDDQSARMLAAVAHPAVRILAHPRGRMRGIRAGVVADWEAVFAAAARRGVAIEIDGDPSRQDIDFTLVPRALASGCLFALDSDAHSTAELAYAETALAHARLAGIPAERIVNCWPLVRLRLWLADPTTEVSARMRRPSRRAAGSKSVGRPVAVGAPGGGRSRGRD